MILVLDCETTWTVIDKKRNPSPFLPTNKLVSVGCLAFRHDDSCQPLGQRYYFFNHADGAPESKENHAKLQKLLDQTTLLVGQNIKFDLQWLRECGFKYNGALWDTMIAEYILARGVKIELSLEAMARRLGVGNKKVDLIQPYFDKGLSFWEIPKAVTETYGLADCRATWGIYLNQVKRYNDPSSSGMIKIRDHMFEFCDVLTDMERNGICIDLETLDAIEKEYKAEHDRINRRLLEIKQVIWGDAPLSFSSPEQLSQFVYGIKVRDKDAWAKYFNLGTISRGAVNKRARPRIRSGTLELALKTLTTPIRRTEGRQCESCHGRGRVQQILRGKETKRQIACKVCVGTGVEYRERPESGSLGLVRLVKEENATAGGFKTDKNLLADARRFLDPKRDAQALEFLELMTRLNQIETYLSTFIGGIKRNVGNDRILHPTFMQCVTATGRLSGRDPNFQNQPRGATFPIKKCFVSRWAGGNILEVDYRALEYRCAVSLGEDEAGKADILAGVDAHTVTAEAIGCNRQAAKSHCVPMHSEILTRSGWKTYETVVVGEDVLTYNANTGTNEWQPLLEKVKFDNADVISMGNNHWSVECTPNHRWFTTKRVDRGLKGKEEVTGVTIAENINSEHKIITSAVAQGGNLPVSAREAAVLGWIWSDGNIRFRSITTKKDPGCLARIIQSNKKKQIVSLRELLKGISSEHIRKGTDISQFSISSPFVRNAYKNANLDYYNPDYVSFVLNLSVDARRAWLQAVIDAEGTDRGYDVIRIAQNSGAKAEAIKLAAYMEGFDIRVTYAMLYTGNRHEQITLRTRPFVSGQRLVKTVVANQDVWCPRTVNGSWVMRQGTHITITGNSFKPLYGGMSGTEKEVAYYEFFLEKHKGIAKWHKKLQDDAIRKGCVTLPTGRQYSFPGVKRLPSGGSTFATQIKNYPVQGFATADIVPLACILLYRMLRKSSLKSLMINEVHDSILMDVYPGEENQVALMVREACLSVEKYLQDIWGYKMFVPLDIEIKIGPNNLEGKELKYEPT